MDKLPAVFNRGVARTAFAAGLSTAVVVGMSAIVLQDKLDTPARHQDYVTAQAAAKEMDAFLKRTGRSDEELVEAYNTRNSYMTEPKSRAALEACFRASWSEESNAPEAAQTVPKERLISYNPPIVSGLAAPSGPPVAVVPFSKLKLTDCVNDQMTAFAKTPSADECAGQFYKIVGGNGVLALIGSAVLVLRERRKMKSSAQP